MEGKLNSPSTYEGTTNFPTSYHKKMLNLCHGQSEEELSSSSVGPGFNMAQLWAKERADKKSKVFSLEVGVKPPGKSSSLSQSFDHVDFRAIDSIDQELSRKELSLCVALLLLHLTFIPFLFVDLLKAKELEVPRRRGALSARAESMLVDCQHN